MTKSKTTLGGLISAIGTALLGIGALPQLSALDPDHAMLTHAQSVTLWYIALAGIIMKTIGPVISGYYAADNSEVQNVASAVDTINKAGPSPLAPPATSDTTQVTKP